MSKATSDKTDEQKAIEKLQSRFDDLSHERTRIEARKEAAQKQLDELRERAKKQFGTDDVAELERQLVEMKKQNQDKRSRYEASLDGIENKLKEIENQFETSDSDKVED